MIHELKILPKYFYAVRKNQKKFEIRENDRNFKVDDLVVLKEWDPKAGFTGEEIRARITYITDYQQKNNYVVFGMDLIDYLY